MNVPPDATAKLTELAAQDNFAPIPNSLYTGVADPAKRAAMNKQFDESVSHFIKAVHEGASEEAYVALLRSEIARFDRNSLDTEDAEQVASSFEQIMDCIGLESSDGALNDWMYVFDVDV